MYIRSGLQTEVAAGGADMTLASPAPSSRMNVVKRRFLPLMTSLEAAAALSEAEHDRFYLRAFMIQEWLGQLVSQAAAEYGRRASRRYRVMQTGQAQRGLLQSFGNVADGDFHGLLESLYRFTEYDHALAGILFRALVSLSIEQECAGDLAEPRAPDVSKRPREAIVLFRRSLERWCDWIDAVVHLRTHALAHLAPESFEPVEPVSSEYLSAGRRSDIGEADGQNRNWEPLAGWSNTSQWQRFNQATMPRAWGSWPFQEVDETAISLWPLVKRHSWTYGDLLSVLRDLLRRPEAQPCQEERVFANYCATALGLHKIGRGEAAKNSRPIGYDVALRLCPPLRPPNVAGEPPWFELASAGNPKAPIREQSEALNFEV